MDEVINDLDLTEEEIALENREEYLNKVLLYEHRYRYYPWCTNVLFQHSIIFQ